MLNGDDNFTVDIEGHWFPFSVVTEYSIDLNSIGLYIQEILLIFLLIQQIFIIKDVPFLQVFKFSSEQKKMTFAMLFHSNVYQCNIYHSNFYIIHKHILYIFTYINYVNYTNVSVCLSLSRQMDRQIHFNNIQLLESANKISFLFAEEL